MEWALISKELPLPVYFHSACVSTFGLMTIFGGVTSINPNVRTCEIYSIWLTIPSLKELCWMSFLNNFDLNYFAQQSELNLLQLGIPFSYVVRLKQQF
jgi:kelch domain-containing protein 10